MDELQLSKNGGVLAVSNEDGWTALDLLGWEGEIAKGDTVFARDWEAEVARTSYSRAKCSVQIFKGCGDKKWALGQIGQSGS